MIKFEGFINEYYCDINIVNEILSEIDSGSEKFVFTDGYSKEKVLVFLKQINDLLDSIQVEKIPGVIEREETEEEAREYFGQNFIDSFNRLLSQLDKQETVVFFHGTNIENCSSICKHGLMHKHPDLNATAVCQEMAYGEGNIEYNNFKQLLNWPHHNSKGITIIAVPYECFYKEGLWNHFKNSESSYGDDYKIDSDFIVGFIDVEKKEIVINPSYRRQHNYEGYIRDNELFYEQKNINNEIYAQNKIESKKRFERKEQDSVISERKDISLNGNSIEAVIEDIMGTLNFIRGSGIRMGIPGKMNKVAYETAIAEINNNLHWIQQLLPYLKTEEELQKEREEWSSVLQNADSNSSNDFDWGEWPELVPEENNKTR